MAKTKKIVEKKTLQECFDSILEKAMEIKDLKLNLPDHMNPNISKTLKLLAIEDALITTLKNRLRSKIAGPVEEGYLEIVFTERWWFVFAIKAGNSLTYGYSSRDPKELYDISAMGRTRLEALMGAILGGGVFDRSRVNQEIIPE